MPYPRRLVCTTGRNTMWEYDGRQRPPFAEAPATGQESVWDFPRPPRLETSAREVVVAHAGTMIARTTRALRLCETASPPTWYVPMADTDTSPLVPCGGRSRCEWKGAARYWALADAPDMPVAWDYPTPNPAYAALADHLAFYPARVECRVDDERVEPQPGEFYGGWVTRELVGPFKGLPGTGHW